MNASYDDFLIAGPTNRKMPMKRLMNAFPTTKKLTRICTLEPPS